MVWNNVIVTDIYILLISMNIRLCVTVKGPKFNTNCLLLPLLIQQSTWPQHKYDKSSTIHIVH